MSSFCISSGLDDSLPSQDSFGSLELPMRRSQGQTKKTLQGSEPSFVKTLLSCPFPTCISFLSGNPVQFGSRPLQLKAGSLARRHWKVCLLKLGSSA